MAGLTLAWCLTQAGHDVIIFEREKNVHDDGYVIDFFGAGYDASERLGLLTRLQKIHEPIDEIAIVDVNGHRCGSIPYDVLRKRLFDDRHFNFMRSDLVRVLLDRVRSRCDIRGETTLVCLERRGNKW